mmetsp:Transcript_53225/g.142390  ORF Transcript_53225/g.142390 Transcript_53225/m.142390 type:complete len:463 (-) Transcript_53225:223-1611(-)
MFLSKDFLEEGDDKEPLLGSPQGAERPGSSHGRPFSSSSSRLNGEEVEDTATPSSTMALRQKMLQQQQRQRNLARQRTAGAMPGGASMVMANQSMPSTDSLPKAATTSLSRTMSMSSTAEPDRDWSSVGLESSMSRMSLEEGDQSGVVMPETCLDSKEDEAKRRSNLYQQLEERGVKTEYDPTPSTGREASFDMGGISSSDMKRFLHDPVPRNGGMIECRIIRDRSGLNKLFPKYTLESDSGIFLMVAKKQKQKTSHYCLSMSKQEPLKDGEGDTFLGKLRSNFLGLEFVAFSPGLNPQKMDPQMSQAHAIQLVRQELVAVQYSSSLWGSKPRGPRKMTAIIPRVQPSGERLMCRTLHPDTEGLLGLQKNSAGPNPLIDSYQNKPPKWNENIGAFVLNFNKRVTQASVKNFQLTNHEDPDTVYLQFGRVGKDVFNMDFRHPFSPFQAFAICLSSFDYKLCCE